MKFDISIIVPIHQASSFIRETLCSVTSALVGLRAEVICVLDSCTDDTAEIIKRDFSSGFENFDFVVIEVELGSVAKARNVGVSSSRGEYLAFVDHDDLVASGAYIKLISHARFTGADIVRCGYSKKSHNYWTPEIPYFGRAFYSFFGIFIWNGVFRRSVIVDNNVIFKEGYGEDYQFNYEVSIVASKISWLKEVLYHWVQHDNNQHKKRTVKDFVARVELLFNHNEYFFRRDPNSFVSLYRFVTDNFYYHSSQFGLELTLADYKSSKVIQDIIDMSSFDYRDIRRYFSEGILSPPMKGDLLFSRLKTGFRNIKSRVYKKLPANFWRRSRFYIWRKFSAKKNLLLNYFKQESHSAVLDTDKEVIGFLVYDQDCISGGIISIFKLAELSRSLNSDNLVQMFSGPGNGNVSKYTRFDNEELIVGSSVLFELVAQQKIKTLHIPEVLVSWFFDEVLSIGVDCRNLHINILNQNTELMPRSDFVESLKSKCRSLTQTTAHEKYSSREYFEKFNIPLTHLSTYMSPVHYKKTSFSEKENNILISHDPHYIKDSLFSVLSSSFVGYEKVTIIGMSYANYLSLTSKSKYMITLGEGMDNYFIETVFFGGIPFTVYNSNFMPSEMADLENVCLVEDDFIDMIDRVIFKCETDVEYREYLWERNYRILSKIYDYEYHTKKLKNFYAGIYDFDTKQ